MGDRGDSRADRKAAGESRSRAAAARRRAAGERAAATEAAEIAHTTIEQLKAALDARPVIGQAAGLLMAEHRISAAAALSMLLTLSENADVTLSDVAARVVGEHDTGEPGSGDGLGIN